MRSLGKGVWKADLPSLKEAIERSSSGGAGGATQAAPDKAS